MGLDYYWEKTMDSMGIVANFYKDFSWPNFDSYWGEDNFECHTQAFWTLPYTLESQAIINSIIAAKKKTKTVMEMFFED